MSTSALHPPLDSAPEATTLTVRALIQRVEKGEIRVPTFQRPLRWKAKHVTTLFDSILRGYPIGSLLFWKRPADADEHYTIGNAPHPVPASSKAWWIVDGQQRVTALSASLLGLNQRRDRRWTISYDPNTRVFHSGPISAVNQRVFVPLSVLGDLRRLGRWLTDCKLNDEQIEEVEDIQQRILDYTLSAYVLETNNEEALRGVFSRMNSTGVKMRADEVFSALLGGQERGKLDLTALQKGCDIEGFGEPPRGEILKAVLAMSGIDPTKRLEALPNDAANNLISPTVAKTALEDLIRFLQQEAKIPTYALIPYPVVFVILARWFCIFPDTTIADRRRLARWLWRAVLGNVHERANVSKFRLQVRLIEGPNPDHVLQKLEREVGEPRCDWRLQPFNSRNAKSRVEILALFDQTPTDPLGPISLKTLLTSGRIAREVFAISSCKDLTEQQEALAHTAANRVLLTGTHSGLETELKQWDPVKHHLALGSHVIDEESFKALRSRNIPTFLSRRKSQLQTIVNTFLTNRAEIGQPTLKPSTSYMVDLEE